MELPVPFIRSAALDSRRRIKNSWGGQPVQEEAQMSDQVEGGGVGVVGNVEHGVPDHIPLSPAQGVVDGLAGAQPGALHILRRPQAVKLQPDVFPGVCLVRGVGGDLSGTDQKSVPLAQLILPGHAI